MSVKTDRRDAVKLVRLYRAGELTFVCPPTPMQEGLRDLVRCRDDLRCARTAARQRTGKLIAARDVVLPCALLVARPTVAAAAARTAITRRANHLRVMTTPLVR